MIKFSDMHCLRYGIFLSYLLLQRCRNLRISLNHSAALSPALEKYGSLLNKEPLVLFVPIFWLVILELNNYLTPGLGLLRGTLFIIRCIGVVALGLKTLGPRFVTNQRLVLTDARRIWTYSSLELRPRLRLAWPLALVVPFFFGVAFLTPLAEPAGARLPGVPAGVTGFPRTLK